MRLRLQIVFSFVAHATLIMTAFMVGRDWTLPVPAEPMTVLLVSGLPEISALNAPGPKKKVKHRPLPTQDSSVKLPYDNVTTATAMTSPAAGHDKGHLITSVGENNSKERSPKESLKGINGPPEALHAQGVPLAPPATAYHGLPAGIPVSGGLDYEQAKTQAKGTNTEDGKAIRKAIEKALIYPLFAKKRGWEGSALTEFTVNAKGYPEGIRIIESSGHNILDTAAKESLIKAAPFVVGKGRYEIPITFRLKSN